MYHLLEKIESTSGRNDKLELLNQALNENQRMTKLIFRLALDQMTPTFVTKIPKVTPQGICPVTAEATFEGIYSFFIDEGGRYSKQEFENLMTNLAYYATESQFKFFTRAILKDLKIGLSVSSYNKVAKQLDLEEIEWYDTMRCSNIEDADINPDGSYVSLKKDGVNGTVHRKRIMSRNGQRICLSHIEKQLDSIKDKWVVFGELVSTTRQSSSGLCNSAIKTGYDSSLPLTDLQLYIFDAMTVEEFESRKFVTRFEDRLKIVDEVFAFLADAPEVTMDIIKVEHTRINSEEEMYALYEDARNLGEEGIVWNDKDGLFMLDRSKKRGRIKAEIDQDFKIVGTLPHSAKQGQIGSFLIETEDGIVKSSCGMGISDKVRIDAFSNPDNYIGKIAKVCYNKVIRNADDTGWTLFIPKFLDKDIIRLDKTEADTFDKIKKG